MKLFFKNHNLLVLSDGIDLLNLHFHDDLNIKSDIYYLCDHC